MASKLRFADGLSLPYDAVTETFGFVGNRGSGKTYGAKRAAEAMLEAGAQIVVIDPVDVWWGLRYGKVRGESGLPVYVFGGIRADVPLETTAGALVADVVVERGISAVLSLRGMNRTAQRGFVRDFLEELYFRKGEEEYRTPIHVFIEEAHTFAPQNIVSGDKTAGQCLTAVQDVFLQGRSSGLGGSLVTQRVAAVSKSVLELVEVMVAFRTTGPNAKKALGGRDGWFSHHDDEKVRLDVFLDTLPALPRGEAYVWSPGLLDVFGRYVILEAETFDSSATPKAGEKLASPKGAPAPLDLEALGEEIAATRERAEANDPAKLHAEIDRLRGVVSEYENQAENASKIETQVVEVVRPAVPEQVIELLNGLAEHVDERFGALVSSTTSLRDALGEEIVRIREECSKVAEVVSEAPPVLSSVPELVSKVERALAPVEPPHRLDAEDPMERAEAKLLATVVSFHPKPITQTKLFVAAGYSTKSSTPETALSKLRRREYVSGGSREIVATDLGLLANGTGRPTLPPAGRARAAYWIEKVTSAEGNLLSVLVDLHPESLSFEELCERAGYSSSSSTPEGAVGSLRRLGLVEGTGADLRASFELMGS